MMKLISYKLFQHGKGMLCSQEFSNKKIQSGPKATRSTV